MSSYKGRTVWDYINECNIPIIFNLIDNETGKIFWSGSFDKASIYDGWKVIKSEFFYNNLWLTVEAP